jgi:glycosyltransferase involved in cell wall biosynthesis
MNIAILTPSHVPFMMGGAERLWSDLCCAINQTGKHQSDIIKIPAPEATFWSIIDSYRKFHELNLDHFDMVISGKNPCWMTKHSNHHLYMLHPLRGVYDTYHLFNLPIEVESNNTMICYISKACDQNVCTSDLFSLLEEFRMSGGEDPVQISLPSPLLRKILHRFDANAMKDIRGFSAISKTVATRVEYYHGNTDVKILPPPSNLQGGKSCNGNYFFTYSRLDEAKRIQMLIDSFKLCKLTNEFRIAGSGPMHYDLIKSAEGDSRILFLGRLSDEALSDELSGCLAVPFIPYQEDYGLVTIESLARGKPVITTLDSGGPTEFIQDGINGFVSEPNIESLANAFQRASKIVDREKMASAARESVSMISWQRVMDGIISEAEGVRHIYSVQKNILSVSTYPIYPPKGGGQSRVFYLCNQLSKAHNVNVICLVDGAAHYEKIVVNDSMTIENIPADPQFSEKDWELYQKSGIPTTDVAFSEYYKLAKSFTHRFSELSNWADVIVSEQPYVAPMIADIAPMVPFIHNSQNFEHELKRQMFRDSPLFETITRMAESAEGIACSNSKLNVFCSDSDQERIKEFYGLPSNNCQEIVYNGAASDKISYPLSKRRSYLKNKIFKKRKVAIFIASWHQPNIEAVHNIKEIARLTPDINYLVIGNIGDYFADSKESFPYNITFTGLVTDKEKDLMLQTADCGINPMSTGSGTNIKMFDYMAAGLPIVSTPVGARGLDLPEDLVWLGDLTLFPELIKEAMSTGRKIHRRIFVKRKYDWDAVGIKYLEAINSTIRSFPRIRNTMK